MLNHINKLLPPRHLRIPLIGLLLVLGVMGERAKPVLSNQIARFYIPAPQEFENEVTNSYTGLQRNSTPESQASEKEARLRRALAKSGSVTSKITIDSENQANTYTWLQRNSNPELESSPEKYTQAPELGLAPTITTQKSASKVSTPKAGTAQKAKLPNRDGVYLYGQSPKAGQFGHGYIVFEKRQSKIMGALYMPSSEFSCFEGRLASSGDLAMTVKGYPGEISPIQVATKERLPRTSNDEPVIYGHSVALEDYYRLNSVSANDRRILQMCKANLQS
ncbi:hypothetical protein QUB80_06110 [Chlorogloeopsis sp. ULAP01]|uniref:hypothetical protein n=1 Tax=Chlorogloeopsis sp. ULAP01 TaxID=3056483 RepID=UPI0025AA62AF|nr:hypothetical protein [Chlorogloeopsis sp. ULAP01]MDM9380276.1 hypothetical protein [Chlorogloeopsis sp. ULAP01]